VDKCTNHPFEFCFSDKKKDNKPRITNLQINLDNLISRITYLNYLQRTAVPWPVIPTQLFARNLLWFLGATALWDVHWLNTPSAPSKLLEFTVSQVVRLIPMANIDVESLSGTRGIENLSFSKFLRSGFDVPLRIHPNQESAHRFCDVELWSRVF
jgi:hypothetical protein